MTQPVIAPPMIRIGNRVSASRSVGSGRPSMTKPMKKPNSAMAAASFSRLSPSMIRASRLGADSDRKIEITAEGSVVETMAPTSRQAASGSELVQDRAKPTDSVATTTATTAITRIGTQSSSIRRRSIPIVA